MGTPAYGARIQYPGGSVDRLVGLTAKPEPGQIVSLRASRWRIIDVQHVPDAADQDEGILYDVTVESVDESD